MRKPELFEKFKGFNLRFTACYDLEITYKNDNKEFTVNYGAYAGQGMHELIIQSDKQTRGYTTLEIPKKYEELVKNMCELARKNQI